jgi:hypothetical protein
MDAPSTSPPGVTRVAVLREHGRTVAMPPEACSGPVPVISLVLRVSVAVTEKKIR